MPSVDDLIGDGELAKRVRADELASAQREADLHRTLAAIDAAVAAHNAKPKRPKPPRRTPDGQAIH